MSQRKEDRRTERERINERERERERRTETEIERATEKLAYGEMVTTTYEPIADVQRKPTKYFTVFYGYAFTGCPV